MLADQLRPGISHPSRVRETRDRRIRNSSRHRYLGRHRDGRAEEELRRVGPVDRQGKGEQAVQAREGRPKAAQVDVEVDGPGDVDDQGG